ncbi:uncharacterized protein LOC115633951 [Scaptodrosophila lebanonensis]|uniref:Uncharacterized protein LOC115633951 n=1 Tax=Drosophila lebanonensis TaxID=7225 RepID=A0A6J2UFW3_DROLE|nr:uncharacterized protein LOC115633951 [Scaptodrosophila lebanonensis]
MIERRSQLDKIIITAMDRFVWFVLLVVMSHLVTEFTRVTGYARGQRNEVLLVNDTMLQPMPVQNMLLYPGHDYAHYERPAVLSAAPQQYAPNPAGNSLQQNAALLLNSLGVGGNTAANAVPGPSHSNTVESSYPLFSFRPLIDSIFEIPISTLRAVNNLVARLTGSYRQAPGSPEISEKSAAITTNAGADTQLRLPAGASGTSDGDFKLPQHDTPKASKLMATASSRMREELA